MSRKIQLDHGDMTSSATSSFTMPITASTVTETTTSALMRAPTNASSSIKAQQIPSSVMKSFNTNQRNDAAPSNLIAMQQPKCVTCGGIVTYTQTDMRTTTVLTKQSTNHDNVTTNCLPNNSSYQQQQPLTIPIATATSQQQPTTFHMNNSNQQQHTTVLPATVTVSTSRGGGTHTTGVPALLRINSSGTVLGGTVLYPQQQAANSPAAESTSINVKKSFVAGQHKGNRNLNLALQSKMLASIKTERSASGQPRMTHSAPSSPRTSHNNSEHNAAKPLRTSTAKTISLNFSNLVSSGAAYIPNSGHQMINSAGGGQIAIAGNMLKLSTGGALFSVALPQMTKASSSAGNNTTVVASNSMVNLVASSNNPIVKTEKSSPKPLLKNNAEGGSHERTAVKTVVKTDLDKADSVPPISHSVDVDSPPTTSVVDSIVVSVAKNTAPVKSSKPSRPMEVT